MNARVRTRDFWLSKQAYLNTPPGFPPGAGLEATPEIRQSYPRETSGNVALDSSGGGAWICSGNNSRLIHRRTVSQIRNNGHYLCLCLMDTHCWHAGADPGDPAKKRIPLIIHGTWGSTRSFHSPSRPVNEWLHEHPEGPRCSAVSELFGTTHRWDDYIPLYAQLFNSIFILIAAGIHSAMWMIMVRCYEILKYNEWTNSDDTALQTQDLKFELWRSKTKLASFQSVENMSSP